MGHYLDGEDEKVHVKMYAGRAMGLSFPTDGNNHNEPWQAREFPVKIYSNRGDYFDSKVTIQTHPNGELISIEISLPSDIIHLDSEVR